MAKIMYLDLSKRPTIWNGVSICCVFSVLITSSAYQPYPTLQTSWSSRTHLPTDHDAFGLYVVIKFSLLSKNINCQIFKSIFKFWLSI